MGEPPPSEYIATFTSSPEIPPLTRPRPHHRERPVGQHGDDSPGDGVEVVDEVPLGRPGAVEERLVEVGQSDAVPLLRGQSGLGFSRMYRSGSGG